MQLPPEPRKRKETERPSFDSFPVGYEEFEPDPDELREELDLAVERQRELLYLQAFLDSIDYYQLLGIEPQAKRKVVRKAFFAMSKRYHPDLFFGKEIGDYAGIVERIFQKLNRANQTLGHKRKRAEYDQRLAAMRRRRRQPMPTPVPIERGLGGVSEARDDEQRKREMAYTILLRRGAKFFESQQFDQAAQEYRRAFALKRSPQAALQSARARLEQGAELDEAALLLRACLRESPENLDAHVLLGKIYEAQGSLELAMTSYREALEKAPGHAEASARLQALEQNKA